MEKALDFLSLRASKYLGRSNLWIAASGIALLAMTILTARPTLAAEFEYSPEGCQFTVVFPEEPYKSRRCDKEDPSKCYDLVSFTKVYDLSATVNFRVICNPIADSIYDQYNEDVMKATLRAMSKRNGISTRNASYREDAGFKQAGLAGEGQVGQTPMIYIAQLWIGEESAFSLEAELIGEQYDAADKLFSDILKTVRFKTQSEIEAEQEAESKAEQNAEENEDAEESQSEE